MSNHLDSVVLPREDRRVWVAATYNEQEKDNKNAYYGSLYDFLNDADNIRHVYWYLRQLKIEVRDYMIEAPWTAAKQNVIEAEADEPDLQLRDVMHLFESAGILAVTTAQIVSFAEHMDYEMLLLPRTTRIRLGHMLSESLVCYRGGVIRHKGQSIRPMFLPTKKGMQYAAHADTAFIRNELEKTDQCIAGLLSERGRQVRMVYSQPPLAKNQPAR